MDDNTVPDIFWEALNDLRFDDLPAEEVTSWRPPLPEGLTDVLEVADSTVNFGRMVHMVGDPSSASVAYTHVMLRYGLLGMRVYFPARAIPGSVGIPAYIIGFKDLPQVRRMYQVREVLERVPRGADERVTYGRAVSAATVQQALRGLAGLAAFDRLPFTLYPLHAA